MNSDQLPFEPISRPGCTPSPPGCVLVGSLFAFLVVMILAGTAVAAYFWTRPKVINPPSVEITAPRNDSELTLGVPVQVWATSNFPEGTTRLELWQSGQQVNSVSINTREILPELQASFQWIPPKPGKFILEVRTYGRSNELNAVASITVNIVDNLPPQVTAANGPVLTAKTSLTVRSGPGETYDPVSTLATGASVKALEQSADQNWWHVALNTAGDTGWIPADTESVSVSGDDTAIGQSVSPVSTPTATTEPTAADLPTSTPAPTATPAPTDTPAPPANMGGMPGEGGPGGPPGGPGGQLPAEAIEACSGLSEGSSCTASSPMGDMTGTCVTVEDQLACMPEGGPPGGRP